MKLAADQLIEVIAMNHTMNHTMLNDYMAHGFCFSWEKGLVWLHVTSDITTGVAYYAIAVSMAYFAFKRRDILFKIVFIFFATFIVACGTTHFLAAYTLSLIHI